MRRACGERAASARRLRVKRFDRRSNERSNERSNDLVKRFDRWSNEPIAGQPNPSPVNAVRTGPPPAGTEAEPLRVSLESETENGNTSNGAHEGGDTIHVVTFDVLPEAEPLRVFGLGEASVCPW